MHQKDTSISRVRVEDGASFDHGPRRMNVQESRERKGSACRCVLVILIVTTRRRPMQGEGRGGG